MPCREQVLSKIIFAMCEVTARTLSFATQKSGAYALCTLHVGVSLVTMSHSRKFWGNHAYFSGRGMFAAVRPMQGAPFASFCCALN